MTAQYSCPACKCAVHINRFDTSSSMCKSCKAKAQVEKASQELKTGLAMDLVLGKSEVKP